MNHLLKICKKNYNNDYFLKNNSDSKRTWKGIKQILHFRMKSNHKLNKIVIDNKDIRDSFTIVNEFNNYFSNIGKNLADDVPHTDKHFMDYLISPLQNSFFLSSVTSTEIELEISKLKNGKSTGPYCIPVAILKQIKHIISKPLAILYNMSFSSGTLPEQFKLAKVIPVYKKGEHTNLANYRPISLLSVFDKLLEKLVSKRLLKLKY